MAARRGDKYLELAVMVADNCAIAIDGDCEPGQDVAIDFSSYYGDQDDLGSEDSIIAVARPISVIILMSDMPVIGSGVD